MPSISYEKHLCVKCVVNPKRPWNLNVADTVRISRHPKIRDK